MFEPQRNSFRLRCNMKESSNTTDAGEVNALVGILCPIGGYVSGDSSILWTQSIMGCCSGTSGKRRQLFPLAITRPANTNAIAGYANDMLAVKLWCHLPRHLASRSSAFRSFCAVSTCDGGNDDDREPATPHARTAPECTQKCA